MTSADHPGAYAYGVATLTLDGTVLDVWYPEPRARRCSRRDPEPAELTALAGEDASVTCARSVVRTVIDDLQTPPTDAYDVYLRLHLLSHRLVAPARPEPRRHLRPADQRRLDSIGPCAVDGFEATRARARGRRPARPGHEHRQVPPHDRLRRARPASASATPTAYASAPTWPRAPP